MAISIQRLSLFLGMVEIIQKNIFLNLVFFIEGLRKCVKDSVHKAHETQCGTHLSEVVCCLPSDYSALDFS